MAARSTTADTRRIASPALRALMGRRTAELAAILLGLLGLAVLVALATYDARDPSLNTATDAHATNIAGPVGAVLADMLLQGLGAAAALPGLALLAWAWRIGSHRGLGSLAGRTAALLSAMPVLAAVLAAIPLPHFATWPTSAGLGGAIGTVLSTAALGAGRAMLGPFGIAGVFVAGAGLAALLTLWSLGLTHGEWRTAGRFAVLGARVSYAGGRSAASVLAAGTMRMSSASTSMADALRHIPGMVSDDLPAPTFAPRVISDDAPPRPAVPLVPATPRPSRAAGLLRRRRSPAARRPRCADKPD